MKEEEDGMKGDFGIFRFYEQLKFQLKKKKKDRKAKAEHEKTDFELKLQSLPQTI